MERMELNIVIEANVPYARGVLEAPGVNVRYLAPEEVTPEVMHDTDALITRTRIKCNERLLSGSRCSIIASATIGLDHVDVKWCGDNGIKVVNAPGCNAPAVAQYVMGSVTALKGADLSGLTIGIVGAGHVGKIVARWARSLGMETLLNDPPRARAEGMSGFVSLEEIARRSDIITFHVPYAKDGIDATHHLCGAFFLAMCSRKPMIINAARGPVADTPELVKALEEGTVSHAVIDCWENEPEISQQLLDAAVIATPHIAGYSRQGKIRAAHAAIRAVAGHLGLPAPAFSEPDPLPAPETVTPAKVMLGYNPAADTHALKRNPEKFEQLRNNYVLRQEIY